MLSVRSINKSFGIQPVLNNINFTLKPGEKAGLVGVNGSGKTTLLRILAGEEKADSGSVSFTPASLRLGYLPQSLHLTLLKRWAATYRKWGAIFRFEFPFARTGQ
jgi:ATPase subunit of ABC transporter with duplicated ATPase domains